MKREDRRCFMYHPFWQQKKKKKSWLRGVNCPGSNLSNFVMNMYQEFVNSRNFGGESTHILRQRIQNPF